MRRRSVLAALATAGVSGCLRVSSEEETASQVGTADGRTETRTPFTDGSTATREGESVDAPQSVPYPIGVSDGGIDPILFSAHTRALTGRGFRTSWQKINDTQGRITRQKTYDVDSGVAVGEWTRRDGGQVTMVRSGTGGYWRENIGDDYVYGQAQTGFDWHRIAWEQEIRPQLAAWDWGTPERVNDDRPAQWEVTADEIANPSTAPGYHIGTVQSFEGATLRVDEDGVIRSLSSAYTVDQSTEGHETLRFLTEYETRAFGQVSVNEPSWVETAREQRPRISATYDSDRRFVAVTIESGSRLAAESRIVVLPDSGPSDRFVVELPEPLEPGVTAYVWQGDTSSTPREARLQRGAPPSGVSPPRFEGPHGVLAYRDTTTYFPETRVE
jgi:hypothetical protein